MFKNKAKTNSIISLVAGLVVWFLPLGIIVAMIAIIFGLIGYYHSVGKNKKYARIALTGVLLGCSGRLIYAYAHSSQQIINASWGIAGISLLLIIFFYIKNKDK